MHHWPRSRITTTSTRHCPLGGPPKAWDKKSGRPVLKCRLLTQGRATILRVSKLAMPSQSRRNRQSLQNLTCSRKIWGPRLIHSVWILTLSYQTIVACLNRHTHRMASAAPSSQATVVSVRANMHCLPNIKLSSSSETSDKRCSEGAVTRQERSKMRRTH